MKTYGITKENYSKIDYAIEKLYKNQDQMIGKTINWNIFTTDLMKFDLPTTRVDKIEWREYRPRWVVMINEGFLLRKYPCQLFIRYNQGVELSIDGAAVREKITIGFEKLLNTIDTGKERAENMIDTFPEAKRIFKKVSSMNSDIIFMVSGMIDASRQIPPDLKNGLRTIVRKHLPAIEE
jgi:hypothetical protein